MAIKIQCISNTCNELNKPKDVSEVLGLFEGEVIVCGGCGEPCRYIGDERPKIVKRIGGKV